MEEPDCIRIAILTHNRSAYLQRTIETLQAQSESTWKACVFDNGSADDTQQVVSKIQLNDDRISLNRVEQNIGSTENFNRAIQWGGQAEFFAILHDDDELNVRWLEVTLKVLMSDNKLGFVGTNALFLQGNTYTNRSFFKTRKGHKIFHTHRDFLEWLFFHGAMIFPTLVFRSSFAKDCPFHNLGRMSDIMWYLAISDKCKVGMCFEPLLNYRIHTGQDSAGLNQQDLDALKVFVRMHVKQKHPDMVKLLKPFFARHWIFNSKKVFKNLGFWSRVRFMILALKKGDLAVFSPNWRYYGTLAKVLLNR